MWQFLMSGLRIGIRGRSFHAVAVFGICLLGVAYLSSSFSPRQPQTVALDIGFSGIRLTLVMFALFWVQELVTREIDRRIILFSLTFPVSRAAFVTGRLIAVVLLVLLAAVVLGFALTLAVLTAGGGYVQDTPVLLGAPFWITLLGLALDVAVVAAVGMTVAMLSTVAMMPLVIGFVFAIAGKALGATMEYLNAGADGDAAMVSVFGSLMDWIHWVLPDLSRLDWRTWPLYGVAPNLNDVFWAGTMAVAYASILTLLSIRILQGREFS